MLYQAVFFDAGETLLAAHPSFSELFVLVMREHGYDVQPADVDQALEAAYSTSTEVLGPLASTTWSTSPERSRTFWRALYGAMFGHWGIHDGDGALFEALYNRFTRYESYRLFPDAVPTVSALKRAGLVTGLISNFEGWLEGMLIEMEVAHLFDVLVISGKEGVEKPDPGIFRLALERTGASPRSSVYVGDNPQVDVEGAAAVGMTPVLIDRRGRYPSFEGIRIGGLGDLPAVLGVDAATGRLDDGASARR
ncbi:MAG: HAD family hydrolase [Actinomycetota bacterium]